MKNTCTTILSIFLLTVLLGCAAPAEQSTDISSEISAINDKFMTAVADQSADAIAEIYTEDAHMLIPNGETVVGKANIREVFQGFLDMGIKSFKLESLEHEVLGDTAWEVGKYALFAEGEVEVDRGKYIIIWKNVDGAWKYHRDIFNSDLPVPTPEPAAEEGEGTE